MNEKTEGANKIVTCGLLFTAQLFSFMIRFAFGVVAPVLMEMYRISPKAMGYVLSGWNWSYTAGLPIMGVIVDRFGPYIVLGVGSRSEEHTSELQSQSNLVCRLLLEKKKNTNICIS